MKDVLRWIFAFPLAILLSSIISSVFPYIASLLLSESSIFKVFGVYIQFFVQGILFVIIVYFVVPSHKLKTAMIAFLLFSILMLISEFYLKGLNSEPIDLVKMSLSILGSFLGFYNMRVMEKADKTRTE